MQRVRPVARPSTEQDLRGIVEDYGVDDTNPLDPFSSLDRLRDIPRSGLWVAEVEGAYAGFVYWFIATEKKTNGSIEKYGRVVKIHVKKEYWNKMVGEILLGSALKELEKQSVRVAYLAVSESNVHLRSLYDKIGFDTYDRTLHMRHVFPAGPPQKTRSREDARLMTVFLVELREQCRVFMTAYDEVLEIISGKPPLGIEQQRVFNARIWSRIQAAFASCAIISKILWPNPPPRKDESDRGAVRRGRELRYLLSLSGPSPFPLAVRNAFEHVDERLEAWLPHQENDIPWGWSLSPYVKGEEPEDSSKAFRYFNMETMELRVAGEQCSLEEVLGLVQDIDSRLPYEAQVVFRRSEDVSNQELESDKDDDGQ